MPISVSAARWGIAALLLSSCGTPPTYSLQHSDPVTFKGRACSADLYTVSYDRLFTIGQPEAVITRDQGTQYRIECGATTTSCKLNQTLEDCIAENDRPESSGSGGYSPPTG